ncbi:MAG: preprotein translocase subunit SecY [Candidatus Aureabacteria bacterium]|nr:preprotein translocase subunit SecY [Candidatus Auribacterota bacterium]
MFDAFKNIFKVPELKKKLFFTFGLLAVCRLGAYVPVPGVNGRILAEWFTRKEAGGGTIFGLMDLFSGGALSKCTVFGLGIMPYISASIIFQLLVAVVPFLEKLAKEGELGRKKLTQYTRYATVVLAMFQGLMYNKFILTLNNESPGIVSDPGLAFTLITMITLTAGTAFLMWLGEQITERGIGNGISLIITINILSRLPSAVFLAKDQFLSGQLNLGSVLILVALMVFVTAGVVAVSQGQRKIPVQYAKRIVGRKVYGGQSSFLPLRVSQAGVIPIIFASSILMFPQTIVEWTKIEWLRDFIGRWFPYDGGLYTATYAALIMAFCYFWTAMQFNPIQIADDMKRYGGFVPGIRPGKPTAEYLENVMVKITFVGAVAIVIIAIMPRIIGNIFNVDYRISQFFGGTGLLIIVGVMLDTMRQIESHLIMRHYEGFVKKGRLKGRI